MSRLNLSTWMSKSIHKPCFRSIIGIAFLYLYHSFALAEINPSWSGNATNIGFVEFNTAEYQYEKSGQIDQIIGALRLLPKETQIHLVGQSQSRKSMATKKLALLRAQVVKKKLLERGIDAERIELDAKATNLIKEGDLLHGVTLLAIPDPQAAEDKPIAINKVVANKVTETTEQAAPATLDSEAETNIPLDNLDLNISKNSDLCAQVVINTGSLKANLEREIGDCGYVMGNWKFGSDTELIDWEIPISYSISVDNGTVGLLDLIENNYQIRGHIHQLDKSIDILPSIKHRRDSER